MSELTSMFPEGFLEDLNENQNIIERDDTDVPPKQDPDEERLREEYEEFEEQGDGGEQKPYWMDAVERDPEVEGEMGQEEMANLAEAFADFCRMGKDLLSDAYDAGFIKALKREFGTDKKLHLIVLQFADEKQGLSYAGVSESLEEAKKFDPKFAEISYVELLDMGIRFKRLKKKFSVKPIRDYQLEGIERYAKLSIQQYLKTRPDPLLLLCIYLGITFGTDLFRLGKIEWQEYRAKQKEK